MCSAGPNINQVHPAHARFAGALLAPGPARRRAPNSIIFRMHPTRPSLAEGDFISLYRGALSAGSAFALGVSSCASYLGRAFTSRFTCAALRVCQLLATTPFYSKVISTWTSRQRRLANCHRQKFISS